MVDTLLKILEVVGIDSTWAKDEDSMKLLRELAEVYQEYLVSIEDKNDALTAMKLKQYKSLFKKFAIKVAE